MEHSRDASSSRSAQDSSMPLRNDSYRRADDSWHNAPVAESEELFLDAKDEVYGKVIISPPEENKYGENIIEETILNGELDDEETVSQKDRFAQIDDEASSSDESNDPEFAELQERSFIVEKYEKGPEQEVEEWENPDFELYKVTDRYGFVHKDEGFPSAAELAERKRIAKETSREQKWLHMMARWKEGKPVDKLRSRVWKGIPEKLRSVVWTYLLEVSKHKHESQKNLYKELLMRARLISKDIKQIDLDINRTYRDHMAFRKRYDVKQKSLFNVLSAYAMYNTEVGYCQGMSQIAALFLMYMDEEDAFWCLHSLLVNKRHRMHGFFVPGFPKLIRFQAHYEKVLQKYLPRVKKHLDKAGIPPIYLTKWWFGCFLDRVPFSLALRLWDVFLLEGDVILIAMSYNIMKMHQRAIRKLQIENFMNYVQTTIAQDFGFPDEEVLHSLDECLRRLRGDRMALPLPAGPNDPPEWPTKPLGPVLTRSMIDIRLDIAEIQSRHSRANSVAGRSPGMQYRGRTPPSPTPVRAKLNSALEAQKEEPEVPSSSSASTIKSVTSQDGSRSGGETPVPQQGSANGSLLPRSPIPPNQLRSDGNSTQTSPSGKASPNVVSVTDSSSVRRQPYDAKKLSVSSRNETVPSGSQNAVSVAEKIQHFSPNKGQVRELGKVPTSRHPVSPGTQVTSSYVYNQHDGRHPPHFPVSGIHEPKKSDITITVPSRNAAYSSARSPPEPPIDYDIAPGSQRNVESPFKSVVHTTVPSRSPNASDLYHAEHAHASYRIPERRVVSPPNQNWPRQTQTASSENNSRNVLRESSGKSSAIKVQRQSFYDNLDDVPTTLSVLPKSLDDKYEGHPENYSMRLGKSVYSGMNNEKPSSSQYRAENYRPIGGTQFSPKSYEAPYKQQAPHRYHREQLYNSEMETRVVQTPNHVTYVSVGEEERRVVKKGQQQSRFPVSNDFYSRQDYTVPRYQSDRQFGHAGERPHQAASGAQTVGYFNSNYRGDAYGAKPKIYSPERRYLPEPERQVPYHSSVVYSHPYSSNPYSNRSVL